jgi:hypothetical protein
MKKGLILEESVTLNKERKRKDEGLCLPIAKAPADSSAYPSKHFATSERESRKLCRAT